MKEMTRGVEAWKKILGEKERCVYFLKGGWCAKKIEDLFPIAGPFGDYQCKNVCEHYKEKENNRH